jgi:hypothetical protein
MIGSAASWESVIADRGAEIPGLTIKGESQFGEHLSGSPEFCKD